MVWRTLIGYHPTGNIGIFVSKPGVDAYGSDPGNRSAWLFSSAIDKQANIIQSGRCGIGDTITHPDMGFVPMALWDLYNNGYAYDDPGATTQSGAACSAYRLQHLNNSQFQIIKQHANAANLGSGSFFRYIVFTLGQDG